MHIVRDRRFIVLFASRDYNLTLRNQLSFVLRTILAPSSERTFFVHWHTQISLGYPIPRLVPVLRS
jgi:hypothetical protein